MPNHITNQITFGSDSAALAAFHRMAHDMKMGGEPLGSFDFNKLIPLPKELDIVEGSQTEQGLELYRRYARERADIARSGKSPAQKEEALAALDRTWQPVRAKDPAVWKLGEQAYYNLLKYGHTSWYGWCGENWGTKWNAYDCGSLQEGEDTITFLTAWASVPNIMRKLSERYPEQRISYRWADENIGYNVGEIILKGGEILEDRTPEPGSRAAYEMAAEILGIDLADFDFYLNKDGTAYEYREEPPVEEKPQTKGKKKSRGKAQGR